MMPQEAEYGPGIDPSHGYPALAALEHSGLLHPDDADGRVSIALRDEAGRWRERSYSLDQLPDVIREIAGRRDAYISQNRFTARRQMTDLYQLGALYVDIDFHKVPALAGTDPRGALEDALILLERARKPPPTLAIFSGRGLYLVWLHTPIPRMAAPRWNRCQRELWEVLRPVGADRGALDAARVLRVAGTVNSKSGAAVEMIAPVGDVRQFEDLADEVLPMRREEPAEIRDIRAARAARRPSECLVTPPKGFTEVTLWAGRFGDLQTLLDLRFPSGKLPPGQRDQWVLIGSTALSWFVVPEALNREITATSRRVADWSDREAARRMQAVLKRARMAARGERIEWDGRLIDPRYHYRNQTIIDLLEITPDEEREMDVIVSRDEARKRDRARKERERREAGMLARADYEAGALAREREPVVVRLRDEDGMSLRRISRKTGIPYSEVHRLVNRVGKG